MRIAIIGVGLIGGSIGLAARERLGATVTGISRRTEALKLSLERGAVDRTAESLADAVADAEAVFVCVPVGLLPGTVGEVLANAPDGCVVSDVGSTKRAVVNAIGDE